PRHEPAVGRSPQRDRLRTSTRRAPTLPFGMSASRALAPAPVPAPNGDPFRQGFVGYVYAGALKWRVMLRLHLELDGCRGRLWFRQAGGPEGWGTEELVWRRPRSALRPA